MFPLDRQGKEQAIGTGDLYSWQQVHDSIIMKSSWTIPTAYPNEEIHAEKKGILCDRNEINQFCFGI